MKLKVGFAGARWLGVNCLKEILHQSGVEVTKVCFPKRDEKVWWTDLVDEKEIKKLGLRITPWPEWKDLKFDLVFSVLHGKIFKPIHLENSRLGIINLHPAPLPEYRGCNSYSHAIMNGEKRYGVSLHYIDEGIDTGDIIGINYLKIADDDTAFSLYQKAQFEALGLFRTKLPEILAFAKKGKRFPAKKQNHKRANYYPRTSLENKEVKISWPKTKIERVVRGLDFPPFEPAFLVINKKKIYLRSSNSQTSGS